MLTTLIAAAAVVGPPQAVELTVYNQGFALVKETRMFDLRAGRQNVAVEDVAQLIEANSVSIRSLTDPGSFSVLEQNYQYDLISPLAILNKAVGHKIVLNRILPNGEKERIVGTLLSSPTAMVSDSQGNQNFTYNGMVLRTDDGRILLSPVGEVEVAELPVGLISKPTLVWDVEASKAGTQQVELGYLTQGMSWNADYVLNLDSNGRLGDFRGWVTLTNNSGATFEGARLKLLAGDVQRVMKEQMALRGAPGGFGGAAMADAFQEETFADYHLYTLQRPANVRNKEIKQVSLLEAFRVPVTKKLVVDSSRTFGIYQPNEGQVGSGIIKPTIQIQFRNNPASNLGMPLPMGNVKVFQVDSGGSFQMLGEDRIQHTPREELVSLTVGQAFDVVAERKRTEFRRIVAGGRWTTGTSETFEIEVRNRKDTAETVTVVERAWGENAWKNASMPYKQLDANTIEFTVELAPNETKKITYTVETRW